MIHLNRRKRNHRPCRAISRYEEALCFSGRDVSGGYKSDEKAYLRKREGKVSGDCY
jgi:hypothetical protein